MPISSEIEQAYLSRVQISQTLQAMTCRHTVVGARFSPVRAAAFNTTGGQLAIGGTNASPVLSLSVNANADDIAIVSFETSCSADVAGLFVFTPRQNGSAEGGIGTQFAFKQFEVAAGTVATSGDREHIHRISVFTPNAGSNTYDVLCAVGAGSITLYQAAVNLRVFMLRRQ